MRKIATIRFSRRGMIRMSTPAINDRIGEMWATVMCMNYLSVKVGRIAVGS